MNDMADNFFQSLYNNAGNQVSRVHYAPRKRKPLSLITAMVAGTTGAAAAAAA